MRFDKNKDENQNLKILHTEIKKLESPYSKILLDELSVTQNADEFRVAIKEKINQYIEKKIKKI